jgi:peroxiredoxin
MQINSLVPDFSLPDTSGQRHRLRDYRGRVVVLNFWSADCPWSERADSHLAALMEEHSGRAALLTVACNLNETEEMIRAAMQQRGLPFVIKDKSCALADSFEAQTTPHAFVIDQKGLLRYQGAVDDVTFRKRTAERFYVREALEAMLEGRLPAVQESAPYGCTIVREV